MDVINKRVFGPQTKLIDWKNYKEWHYRESSPQVLKKSYAFLL